MAAVVLVASAVGGAHSTGLCNQKKLDHDGANYWYLFLTSTNVLSSLSSPDFVTWTSRTTKTLTNAHNSEARNQSVRIVNNGTAIALHAELADRISSSSRKGYHLRGTISGTTITYGSQTQVGSSLTASDSNVNFAGGIVLIDSNFKVYQSDNFNTTASQNFGASNFPNADNSSSWTQGSATITSITTASTESESSAFFDLGSSNVLALGDNGAVTNAPTNVFWSKWNTSSWSPTSSNNVFSSSVTIDPNDWGSGLIGATSVLCMRRSGASSFDARLYSIAGNTWSTPAAGVPTLATKAGTGLPMIYDPVGAKLYIFAVGSDGANTISYITFDGTNWGSWTTFESASKTRTNLGLAPVIVSSAISVYWTQVNGANFDIAAEQLVLSTSHALAASVTSGSSVTGALTVSHPLAASATSGASVTAALTVKHPLTASITSGASVSGALTWHHALKTSALAGASVTGALTVQHKLATSATSGASVTGALTVKHPLATSATSGASTTAALTVKHPLAASATSGASVSGLLTVISGGTPHALAASVSAGASVSAALTVQHPLTAQASAATSTTGLLTVKHPLAASALSGASVTGHAAVTRKLTAAATSGAALQGALTIQHRLSATIASSTTALGLLTWYHALFVNVTSTATVSANPTIHLSAKVAPVGTASASPTPTGGIGAGIVPADSVAGGITPSGTITASVVPSGTIERG